MLHEIKNVFGRIFYRIEYHADLDVVEAKWYNSASRQDFQQALLVGLEVHEKTGCAYRLNDNTDFSMPWTDLVDWIEEFWLPRAHAAGVRFLAHVATPGSFGEAAGVALNSGKAGAIIQIRIFHNRQEATDWLLSKQKINTRQL